MFDPKQIIPEKPILFGIESLAGGAPRGQASGGGLSIATFELNRPQVLNALSTQSYVLIEPRLLEWQNDTGVAAVCISSRSDKAFCAGGDVKDLILNIKRDGISAALDFFTREYFVDSLLQTYNKPIIAICNGITMGGGIGISNGAGLRVATEKTMVAMPELSIGLFPDVGATRFLHRVRKPYGVFMGLTGARLSGLEAVRIGLMNAFIPSQSLRRFRADLLRLPWSGDAKRDREFLKRFESNEDDMHGFAEAYRDSLIVESDQKIIEDVFSGDDLAVIDAKFMSAQGLSSWLNGTRERYNKGSALARAVFFHAFKTHRELTMPETFQREWEMAIRFSKDTEFAEGVRAVLIDKDQAPKWKFSSLQALLSDSGFRVEDYMKSGEAKNLLAEKWAKLSH